MRNANLDAVRLVDGAHHVLCGHRRGIERVGVAQGWERYSGWIRRLGCRYSWVERRVRDPFCLSRWGGPRGG